MSSTNRSAVRQPDDFYSTPGWATRAILPHLDLSGRILEPGCGDGAIIRELVRAGVSPNRICGVELDEVRAHRCLENTRVCVHRGDFLKFPWSDPERYDLSIGNPPFSHAKEFVERSMKLSATVCKLLRLNFMGSQERAPWHRKHPADVFVLPRRPSFTESLRWSAERGERRCALLVSPPKPTSKPVRCDRAGGHDGDCLKVGTDSCEYMWALWGPGRTGKIAVLDVESGGTR